MFVRSSDAPQKRIGKGLPASGSNCGSLRIKADAGSNFVLHFECEVKVVGIVRLTLQSVERLAAENVKWLRKQLDDWFEDQLRLAHAARCCESNPPSMGASRFLWVAWFDRRTAEVLESSLARHFGCSWVAVGMSQHCVKRNQPT